MKKIAKYGVILLLLIVVIIAAVVIYIKTALPSVGEPEAITIDYTPERIARGQYLTMSVCGCMDCHSKRDWTRFSGPLVPGTAGQGGERFDQQVGFPGVYYSRNITPFGLKRYTDGELFRVITTGVNKEGVAMFPVMPFPYYRTMDREDIYDVIAYIRSLEPIENEVPVSTSDFPMNLIINTIPTKADQHPKPSPTDQLAYGAYLVNAGGCIECHTQVDKGMIIPEVAFSGGREFPFTDGSVVRSANITPDPKTGIGNWTEELFVTRFKMYADSTNVGPVNPGEFNTWMPWTMYSQMDTTDLKAMFCYLKSLKPIENSVNKFTAGK